MRVRMGMRLLVLVTLVVAVVEFAGLLFAVAFCGYVRGWRLQIQVFVAVMSTVLAGVFGFIPAHA